MVIVGISSGYHDSSVAVVVDGVLKIALAEERLSLQKHDAGFPTLALRAALDSLGLKKGQIDHVAYYEDPSLKFTRVLAASYSDFPRGWKSFARSMKEMAFGSLLVKYDIFRETGIPPQRIHYVPHHLSHAASTFAPSLFEDAAVLVLDAVGEWGCTSIFHGKRVEGKLNFFPINSISYPHSLGLFYSAFTAFCGFRVNDGECNLMALAAFGTPKYRDLVTQVLRLQSDGTYELDLSFFDFADKSRLPLSAKFYDLFGASRSYREKYPFALFEAGEVRAEDQRFADLAASVQLVLEEAALGLCGLAKRQTNAKLLCLAGGVALNSAMVGRLMRESGFAEIFVPPDSGDGGGAMGAALYLANALGEFLKVEQFSPYLGLDFGATDEALLRGVSHRSMSESEVREEVCRDLADGKVVGWFQGRFELGPRALGNRSLLIDPANRNAARKLSRIKSRASFRPYACTVTERHSDRLFDFVSNSTPLATEWMSSVHKVKEQSVSQLREALHVNGTTRPQILKSDSNPLFHKLLAAWGERSGLEALLNTSMNGSGFPMAASPYDALLLFRQSDMDTLVLNDILIRKN